MTETQKLDVHRFLPGIHGLRAIAALSVLLFHQAAAMGALEIPFFAKPITIYGGLGVPLFFVLSAFSLAHSTHHRTGEDGWVHEYALRRYFRIAPMFYMMIIFVLISHYVRWGKLYSPFEVVLNMVFLFGLVPGKHEALVSAGWTVGVEMLFYALFPAILSIVRGVKSAGGFFLFSCIAGLAVTQELSEIAGIDRSYLYENLCTALPSFAAGLGSYYVLRELRGTGGVTLASITIPAGLVTFVGIAVVLRLGSAALWWVDLFTWVCAVAFSIIALWQAAAPSLLLSARFFQYVGERSYSVYLVHAPIVFNLKPVYDEIYRLVPIPSVAYLSCVALAIVCVLFVASITYTLVEAPGIRFGAALIRNRRAKLSTTTAYVAPAGVTSGRLSFHRLRFR